MGIKLIGDPLAARKIKCIHTHSFTLLILWMTGIQSTTAMKILLNWCVKLQWKSKCWINIIVDLKCINNFRQNRTPKQTNQTMSKFTGDYLLVKIFIKDTACLPGGLMRRTKGEHGTYNMRFFKHLETQQSLFVW